MRLLLTCFVFFTISCKPKVDSALQKDKIDIKLANTYKKFYANRYDYGDDNNSARDTILTRFKNNLLKVLANPESRSITFDSLGKEISIIKSKDNKLRIFSWDELNGGTWHNYNSVFQYIENEHTFSGFLKHEDDSPENPLFTDTYNLNIDSIDVNSYVVKSYGTHGAGKDFITYRLLSFKDGKLTDCNACFEGKNIFVHLKPRQKSISSEYNNLTKSIVFTDKKTPSETTNTSSKPFLQLKYTQGKFVKLQN